MRYHIPTLNLAKPIKWFALVMVAAMFLSTVLTGVISAQGTTTMTASSSAGSVARGSQFQVTINVNASTAITGAQAYVEYEPSELELVSESYSGSPFNTDTPDSTSGNGYYQVSRFKAGGPYPSGTFRLVQFTFKALKDSGSTAIKLVGANSFAYDEANASNVLSSVSGVSVNLTAPASTPAPGTQTVNPEGQGQSTPASSEGNNGTPVEETPVTEDEAAQAADKTTERSEEAKKAAAENAGKVVATATSTSSKKLPWPLLAGLGCVALAAIGFIVARTVITGRRNNLAPAHASPMAPSGNELESRLNQISSPKPPEGGAVIAPENKSDDNDKPAV